MVRRTGSFFIIAVLLAASLVTSALQPVLAQGGGTPTANGDTLFTAAGVQTGVLAAGDASDVAVPDAHLTLERLTVPSGARTGLHTTAGPELLFVEKGAVIFHDSFGFSSTQTAPAHLLMAASAGYAIENASGAPAAVLRLGMAAGEDAAPTDDAAMATPVASPVAVPVVVATTAPPVSAKVLIDTAASGMPQGDVTLSIGRAVWSSGAASGKLDHAGPLGVAVEEGTLNITSPSGMEGQVAAGQSVVLPPTVALQTRNTQDGPATALIVTIAPAGKAGMSAVTPTPAGTVAATVAPTEAAQTSDGTVLYEATGNDFVNWPKSEEWQSVSGQLVSAGQNGSKKQWIPAPFVPDTANYAVEAEVQVIRWRGSFAAFALVARGTPGEAAADTGGYSEYFKGAFIGAELTDSYPKVLTKTGFDPGGEWHTYRLEVQGNVVTLLIDGNLVLQTKNNTNLAPGRVGLASAWMQVGVRSFKVIALGEGASGGTQAVDATQAAGPVAPVAVAVVNGREGVSASSRRAYSGRIRG